MRPELAITVSTPSATIPSTVLAGVELPTHPLFTAPRHRHFVLSAVACGLAVHVALIRPSFASSDGDTRIVLAGDSADPFWLAQQPLAPADIDLAAAIRALVAEVSDDEWEKLPTNLASRVDEFLYDNAK